MLFSLREQLSHSLETLRLVSDVVGSVELGQKVNLQVLSSADQLVATDKVLDIRILNVLSELVALLPVRMKVKWEVWREIEGGQPSQQEQLTPGMHYLETNGSENLTTPSDFIERGLNSFVFLPPLVEFGVLGPVAPKPVIVTVKASVILEVKRAENTEPTLISEPALMETG